MGINLMLGSKEEWWEQKCVKDVDLREKVEKNRLKNVVTVNGLIMLSSGAVRNAKLTGATYVKIPLSK
jgi:hypothetical protein